MVWMKPQAVAGYSLVRVGSRKHNITSSSLFFLRVDIYTKSVVSVRDHNVTCQMTRTGFSRDVMVQLPGKV